MHSESQIKRAVKILLEEYGALNTSEIKKHLSEVLNFDSEDLFASQTRQGECLIHQRIGNVVSHQSDIKKIYSEGFIIDKSFKPALWILIRGNFDNELPLSNDEIKIRRNRLGKHDKQCYKKINWEYVNERQSTLGILGEEFVYQYEIDIIEQIDIKLIDRIQHLSAMQGDGFGYDILSVDANGNSKYIEVKTTTSSNPLSPFYMSINERRFFEENMMNNAYIYRVYNFDVQARMGKIMIISAEDLFNNFEFDPISFRVFHRGN